MGVMPHMGLVKVGSCSFVSCTACGGDADGDADDDNHFQPSLSLQSAQSLPYPACCVGHVNIHSIMS